MPKKRFDELTEAERDEMIGVGLTEMVAEWCSRYGVRAGSVLPLYDLYSALKRAARKEWERAQEVKQPQKKKGKKR